MTQKTKAFEKAIELVLKATPEVLSPVIKTVASEFTFKDLHYWSTEEAGSASSAFRKMLITILDVIEDSIASEDCIGIITLQSLASDKTLFRIPPRSEWYINIEPKTLPQLSYKGHINKDVFNLFWDESYFTHLLERLFAEFQRLEFVDFREKPPIGFKLPYKEKDV